jgi:hypothetical protein
MTPILRAEWGARAGRGNPRTGPAKGVVLHHSYSPHVAAGTPRETVAAHLRTIERYHAENLTPGNPRIGYNWLVDQDGRVWEGIGWGRIGAHAPGANSSHEGVCVLINAETHRPTDAAWAALQSVIRAGVQGGHIAADYEVRPHSDYRSTTCPGRHIAGGLARLAPAVVLPSPDAEPGESVWYRSRTAGRILPVRVESDARWWFVRWSDLARYDGQGSAMSVPVIRAATPLSQMPREVP